MKSAFIVTIALASTLAMAKSMKCHTPNNEKVITIADNKVSLHHESPKMKFNSKRKISSATSVRTKKTVGGGFNKFLKVNNMDYKIHISDTKNLNSIDDYLTISIKDNYKLSYPLHCKWVN